MFNALGNSVCECSDACCVFNIAGIKTNLCAVCADIIMDTCIGNLKQSPHSMTFHVKDKNNYSRSFCAGTVMRE